MLCCCDRHCFAGLLNCSNHVAQVLFQWRNLGKSGLLAIVICQLTEILDGDVSLEFGDLRFLVVGTRTASGGFAHFLLLDHNGRG